MTRMRAAQSGCPAMCVASVRARARAWTRAARWGKLLLAGPRTLAEEVRPVEIVALIRSADSVRRYELLEADVDEQLAVDHRQVLHE